MDVNDFIDHGTSIINRPEGEDYARFVLNFFRMPATLQFAFEPFYLEQYKLFCVYKGEKHRVIGASRLGDIWLTKDFTQNHGYLLRVDLSECSNWSKD